MILLATGLATFSPFHFLIGFVILICVLAIVIIGCRWLLSLTGLGISQPLLLILGIVVFLILFIVLLNYSGLYAFR